MKSYVVDDKKTEVQADIAEMKKICNSLMRINSLTLVWKILTYFKLWNVPVLAGTGTF